MTTTINQPSFLSLPVELHLQIASHLPYPDALSLKHSSVYFSDLIDTGLTKKVTWLISRRRLQLECPHLGSCVLKTDEAFVKNKQVIRVLRRRRRHLECRSVERGGCLVLADGDGDGNSAWKCEYERWALSRVYAWQGVSGMVMDWIRGWGSRHGGEWMWKCSVGLLIVAVMWACWELSSSTVIIPALSTSA